MLAEVEERLPVSGEVVVDVPVLTTPGWHAMTVIGVPSASSLRWSSATKRIFCNFVVAVHQFPAASVSMFY